MPDPSTTEVVKIVGDMARVLPRSILDQLANKVDGLASSEEAQQLTAVVTTAEARAFVERLIDAWNATSYLSSESVSLALRTAAESIEQYRSDTHMELVWTGPLPGVESLPRINAALLDLVDSAEHHLLIVTFVAFQYPHLTNALRDAVRRGVSVALVLESSHEDGGQASVDPAIAFANSVPDAEVYRWPAENRGTTSAGNLPTLHAKCAVADSHTALFSSANFTEPAMESNIEIGLVVRGGEIPAQVRSHFRNLITRGSLTPA